jgi:methyl-accepting chemotaxis protein
MKWFYDMKIASKLICFSLLMAIIAAMVGYVGITQLTTLKTADTAMYEDNVLPLGKAAQTAKNLQKLRVMVRDSILAETKEEREKQYSKVRDTIAEIEAMLKDYESSIRSNEDKENYAVLAPSIKKYSEQFDVFADLLNKGKRVEALAYMKGPFLVTANVAVSAVDKMVQMNTDAAKVTSTKNVETADRGTRLALIILFVGMAVAVGLGLWISRVIANPIKQVAERAERLQNICIANLGKASEEMAHGNLDIKIVADTQPLQMTGKDEVGNLARSVDGIITRTQSTITSFEAAMANLRKVTEEINGMIKSAQAGDLASRGKADQFEGGYRQMIAGFNATLDAVVGPLQMASHYIDRISKGDIPPKINEHYNGDFNNIKNSLNLCIETLHSLIEEDGGAALLAAAEKDLTARVDRNYQGAFETMKTSINTLIKNLDEALTQVSLAAEQVASASVQISSGSQTLSQGSSEQASSLEEVSSSLQEMASMTRRNAENAKEARSLTESALTTADRGVESMKRLSEAIVKIKVSSDSTAKIVKTIDEIAFQTNLLALNAAVEAARAGDAGKGFAVVAEEVRNLAMRSAEAAKNTANMIEESVKNAEGGVSINQEVLENLTEINGQVNKVSAVMAEIAAASEQQSQGVEQVNTAVEQMNQVTQQIAANSEESASAAEELSGQAEEMKGMVAEFRLTNASTAAVKATNRQAHRHAESSLKTKSGNASDRAQTAQRHNGGGHAHINPAKLIPFDSEDQSILKDF